MVDTRKKTGGCPIKCVFGKGIHFYGKCIYFGVFIGQQNIRLSRRQICMPFLKTLVFVQGGWPTGNGKKLSNSQACCLAQLCLAAP